MAKRRQGHALAIESGVVFAMSDGPMNQPNAQGILSPRHLHSAMPASIAKANEAHACLPVAHAAFCA